MPLGDDPDYQKLITAYDEYIAMLENEGRAILRFAFSRGYRAPNDLVALGEELRAKIARLRTEMAE